MSWASGIGVGLTLCMPYLKSSLIPDIVQNIEIAVNTTLKYGFNKSHCICHGSLGNVELLILAGQALYSLTSTKYPLTIGATL
ncbi:lanthionine synthetase LanC family protein [Paenibacillus jamilae]|uniref:lanthionine synthetase LanC family protein n=1 Tax=Paenibacillus jamilae TaxID=114136 RepID=UPI003B013916